jgi:hypothetical protein
MKVSRPVRISRLLNVGREVFGDHMEEAGAARDELNLVPADYVIMPCFRVCLGSAGNMLPLKTPTGDDSTLRGATHENARRYVDFPEENSFHKAFSSV